MAMDTHAKNPTKMRIEFANDHLIVIVKVVKRTSSIILPAKRKYFLLASLVSSIGKPGIDRALLSITRESDNAKKRPPMTLTFLKKKEASKKRPYMIPCNRTIAVKVPVAGSG